MAMKRDPRTILNAIIRGASRAEVSEMIDDEQREMLLGALPTLKVNRRVRRKAERGLRKKEKP